MLCFRSWGFYLVLGQGKHWKAKLLYFRSGKKISHQYHNQRNELWCVVFGGGILSINNQKKPLMKGETAQIFVNDWHQFLAHVPTLILEIQYGPLCSESDIVRTANAL